MVSQVGEESACSAGAAGDQGSIPGPGRSPGGGNGNPSQYRCLRNLMHREAWWATVHGVRSLGREAPLEEEMATHPSIVA